MGDFRQRMRGSSEDTECFLSHDGSMISSIEYIERKIDKRVNEDLSEGSKKERKIGEKFSWLVCSSAGAYADHSGLRVRQFLMLNSAVFSMH